MAPQSPAPCVSHNIDGIDNRRGYFRNQCHKAVIKKTAFRTTLQHAPALAKPEALLRLTAFIAIPGKDGHSSLFRELFVIS
jgi:hypothetical protein